MSAPAGKGDEDESPDRQYRSNMQGLLQFCADATKAEDAPQSGAQEMEPEVRHEKRERERERERERMI